MTRKKLPETIKLSELLAIGVKYINFDSENIVIFNDGTRMWGKYTYYTNDSGTSFDDLHFWCVRPDGSNVIVFDDVRKTLNQPHCQSLDAPPQKAETVLSIDW